MTHVELELLSESVKNLLHKVGPIFNWSLHMLDNPFSPFCTQRQQVLDTLLNLDVVWTRNGHGDTGGQQVTSKQSDASTPVVWARSFIDEYDQMKTNKLHWNYWAWTNNSGNWNFNHRPSEFKGNRIWFLQSNKPASPCPVGSPSRKPATRTNGANGSASLMTWPKATLTTFVAWSIVDTCVFHWHKFTESEVHFNADICLHKFTIDSIFFVVCPTPPHQYQPQQNASQPSFNITLVFLRLTTCIAAV